VFRKHLDNIEYQNLHFHLKDRKLLSYEFKDMVERMVIQKEGGLCYEHCQLTHYVLTTLGFDSRFVLLTNLKNDELRFNPNTYAEHSM